MKDFNKRASYFPNKDRAQDKVSLVDEKTMVEQEQIVPALTPDGMQDVANMHYKARLSREHDRVKRLNDKAKKLYQTPLSELQRKAAQMEKSAEFNAQANQLHSSRLTQTRKETLTMSTENDTLSDDQKHYIATLSNKKRLYQAHKQLQNAVTTALNNSDNPQTLKLAQDISAASQTVQAAANYLHHQQKTLEDKHPEFKAQAVEYSKSRQQNRSQEHSL